MPVLFFKPLFMKRIWGDQYFKNELKYDLDFEPYGEMWSLSSVKGNETIIENGEYQGMTLSDIFLSHNELFNFKEKEFPLLIKLIHTKDLLSVQVHPDDDYALKNENQLGKTECWYFLDSSKDSFIYYGHHSKNKDELKKAIEEGKCEQLLNKYSIKKDDFAYIPSRTIHALGKDLLLLEIQQSSDVTYRLYDYNRLGLDGKPRQLHISKALDVIDFNDDNQQIINFQNKYGSIVTSDFFDIEKVLIKGEEKISLKDNVFHIISVIKGSINLQNHQLKLGESCLTTCDMNEIVVNGNAELLITTPKKKEH